MKIRTIVSYGVVFLSGFVFAWFGKPPVFARPDGGGGRGMEVPRVTKIQRSPDAGGSRNSRVDGLLKKLGDVAYSEEKKKAVLSEIETGDFRFLMERIVHAAGFTGLDDGEQGKLGDLVAAWCERDLDAALSWVEQIGNPKDRKTLLDELISHVAEKDLQKGLELARRYCRKENGNWDIPYQLGSAIFSQDAENMVRTVGEFVSSGDSSSGMGAQLPVAYDFRKALDGLAALNASLKPGEKLAFVPTNLLEEWTRRDPSAAWEWVGEGKVVPFNGREKFLKTYCSSVGAKEAARVLVDAKVEGKSTEEHFQDAWSVMAVQPRGELIQEYLACLPGEREENVAHLFKAANGGFGGCYDTFKELLVLQMTPEERVSVFAGRYEVDGCRESESNFYEPLLRRLGHGEEEIRKMLPPSQKSPK